MSLRLFYPSDLVKADAAKVMHDGHLTLFGISGDIRPQTRRSDALPPPRPSARTAAIRSAANHRKPSQPPTAAPRSLLLPRSTPPSCSPNSTSTASHEHQINSTTLLPDIAEIVNKVPGMKSIAQPSWYNVGWQKVHMAAAQGQPRPPTPPARSPPPHCRSIPWASLPTGTIISSSGTSPPTTSIPSTASPRPPSASDAPRPLRSTRSPSAMRLH